MQEIIEIPAKTTSKETGRMLSPKEKAFIDAYVIRKLSLIECLKTAGYKPHSATASRLIRTSRIKQEIGRLQNSFTLDAKKEIEKRFPKAMDVYDDLLENGKESTKKELAKDIVSYNVQRITLNKSVKYNINVKEMERRRKLLEE